MENGSAKISADSAPDNEGALTVEAFCARYGIGRTATYEEINGGRLEIKKRGSRTLIPRAEARRWLANLPGKQQAATA
jgi:hypothetical protein